jgi:hypothetical protein
MREAPNMNEEYDVKEWNRLKAPEWMLEALKLNPSYVYWGPHEDYMLIRGRDEGPDDLGREPQGGWNSRLLYKNWSEFGIELDELNECINFYFSVERKSKNCPVCYGCGYHPDAQWVSESYYAHSSPFKAQSAKEHANQIFMASFTGNLSDNSCLGKNIYPTQDILDKYGYKFTKFCEQMRETKVGWHQLPLHSTEIKALKDAGRENIELVEGINKGILVRTRCERFGIPLYCTECEGRGDVFVETEAHLMLTLWIIHPRKGASRGVEIEYVSKDEFPLAVKFLQEAAKRNAERFENVSLFI